MNKVSLLNDNIILLFNLHAPTRTVKISKKHEPWITDTIKQMIKLRKKPHGIFLRQRSPKRWSYYKELRNLVISAVRREKEHTFLFFLVMQLIQKNCGRC